MNRLLLGLFWSLIFTSVSYAQQGNKTKEVLYRDSVYRRVIMAGSDSLNCYLAYPIGGSKVLMEYGENEEELDKIDLFVFSTLSDTLVYVRSVRIVGYSSVDGSYTFNERLAKGRAEGLKDYLNEKYGLSSQYNIEVRSVGEDWEGLRRMLSESDLPYKEQAIRIIDGSKNPQTRERGLLMLNEGEAYKEMTRTIFPRLRRVEIKVEYDLRKLMEERYKRKITDDEYAQVLASEQEAAKAEEIRLREVGQQKVQQKRVEEVQAKERFEELKKQESYIRMAQKREEEERKEAARRERKAERYVYRKKMQSFTPLIGIKTNLVSWIGVTPEFEYKSFMPNVAVEVFIGNRWSINASATYASNDSEGGKQHWGISGYSLEPRCWLKGIGFYDGFYFGAYGQAGDFDVRNGETKESEQVIANHTGTYLQFGLSAGYYLMLTKHWGVELGLRGGYQSGDANQYVSRNNVFYPMGTVEGNRVGLMQINVSASYRF